ncbi:uncharacterized protein KRP23_3219 [Phytophthora ramorum]|uniref:uncharacterized protein n=1 Tax=Phytophthora ramorum TaxID=164328 RepID=UPI0030B0C72B|nr:hypothetical protein KRP23_3219 [Phytophthora ramorum]
MADPAWGAMSLSDEEMARALCAFQHKEPLPTQRRRPLQPRPRQPEMPQLAAGARAASGLSAFGYPSNGATYHTAPMSARQDEAASLLMGMHSPSTSSDDWQQQQKRAIQEQIEQQQRELQAQMQAQQQRDMQAQLQQIQAQIQRQEQLHRQQEQVQQHVQRHVERIQQSPYASGIDQTRWGGHMSLSDGGSQRTAVQRPTQFYDGGFQRSQLLPVRPTTTTTTTSAYAVDYAEDSQAGVSMSRNEGRFAAQQGPPPAQSHFRARNPEHFAASALHPWEMSEPLSFSGIQVDRTKMQTMQQFMPQQHQQPQPYHSAEVHQRSDHEASMLMRASRVAPDVTFLNGVMRHFPTSGGSNVGALTTTATSNAVSGMSRDHKLMFTPAPAQLHPRAQYPVEVRAQMDAQSRMPLPPTGTTIVPGVSLASQPTRLISMRDLLNVEEMASKVASSRGRPRGSKQQLAPPKRKPQKKPPGKPKIWRKYQDQLKKQEDWREVRVAGKRTRYLNSRYADGLRRQHNKTYKRAARPRKKTAQGVQVACSHEATSLAAHADPVELRKALAKLVNNDAGKSSPPGTPELTADADSGSLASATEIVSNGKHDNSSLVVMRQNAPVKQQEQNCLHISSDGRETKSAASNSHNTVVVPTDLQARADVTNPTSDGNFKTAAAPKANVVANATSNANIELTTEASEGNLPVHNAVSDRHLAASHESPSGNISTSFIGESSSGSIAVSDAVPDNIVIVRAANEARIDSIDSAITRANDNMNSTSPESNIKFGIAVVATGSNGETVVTACVAESNTDEPVIPSQATKEQAINDPDDVFGDNPSQPSAENAEPHPLLGEMSAKSKDHCTNLATPMME